MTPDKRLLPGLCICIGLLSAGHAADFVPTDDAYVSEANPTTNYGASTVLRVRSTATGNGYNSYLKFNVTGISGNVVSARVYLYSTDVSTNITLYSVPDTSWSEGTITWSNRRATGALLDTVNCVAGANNEFDVSGLVTSNGTYAFCLKDYELDVTDRFRSKENSPDPVLRIVTGINWRVVDTGYPTEDMVVAGIVMDSGRLPADPATEDCSAAFNAAFQDLSAAGGGFVYAPEGEYLFTNSISLQPNVVLRGAWGSVAGSNKTVRGTILKCTYNSVSNAFIELNHRAGLRDLTIWYPDQSITNVIPYAPTIDGSHNEINIENVNLVNSYIGLSPQGNLIRAHVRNIFGSPLKLGMYQSRSSDVPTYSGVYYSADYWADSGLPGAPDKADLQSYMRTNATGIKVGASDNIFAAEWYVADCNRGFHFVNEGYGTINGNIYGLHASNCSTGLQVDAIGPTFIINSSFEGSDEAATLNNLGSKGVLFNGCTFTSGSDYAVNCQYNGNNTKVLTFQHCTFNKKILAGSSDLAVVDSTFTQNAPAIRLTNKTGSAIVAGNTFAYGGDPIELNGASAAIVAFDSNPTYSKTYTHFDIHGYNTTRKPADTNFVVMGQPGYSVSVDGTTDDAPVIQQALDDVSALGGGIVFVPQIDAAGYAIRTPLNIPAGVELRSSAEGTHSFNGGKEAVPAALLQIYHGRNGTSPAVTLNTGSGLKGFTIHYPEQFSTNIVPYSFTVKAVGDNAYVQNVQFLNSYDHIEFNGSDSHLAENILATHLHRTIKTVNCVNGRLNHINTRDEWDDSGFPTLVTRESLFGYSMSNSVPYEIISSTNEQIYASFSRMSKWLGIFSNSSLHTLDLSMESCNNAFLVDGIPAGQSVELIGSSVRVNNDIRTHVTVLDVAAPPGDGDFQMYSALCTGYPDTILRATDANVTLQQCYFGLSKNKVATHGITLDGSNSSTVRVENCSTKDSHVSTTVAPVTGKQLELVGNTFFQGLEDYVNQPRISGAANWALPAVGVQMNLTDPGESGMELLSVVYDLETRDADYRQWYSTVTGYYPNNFETNLRFEVTASPFAVGSEPVNANFKFFYYDWEPGDIEVAYKLPGQAWLSVTNITLTGDGGYVLPRVKLAKNPYFHLFELPVPGALFAVGSRFRLTVNGKAFFSYVTLESGNGMQQAPFGVYDPVASWLNGNFTDAEQNNPAVGELAADPDIDGRNNLLEFVQDTPPRSPDAGFNTAISESNGTVRLTFVERNELGDITRQISGTTNLMESWTALIPGSEQTIEDYLNTSLLEATFSSAASQMFYRIEYTAPD